MRTPRLLTFVLLLIVLSLISSVSAQNTYSKVRIYPTEAQWDNLSGLGMDLEGLSGKKSSYIDVIVTERELSGIKEDKIEYSILIPDVTAFYAERAKQEFQSGLPANAKYDFPVPEHFELGSMAGYYTLDEVIAELDQMRELYPGLISVREPTSTDTLTHEGRSIYWVRISDNPDLDEDEPEILYTGMHHSREVISMETLLYYMWYLLENYSLDTEIRNLVNQTEMYFVPVVNPDGYEYNRINYPSGGGMWRKNRCDNQDGTFGVDINRNYSYQWGFDNTGSSGNTYDETYRGVYPMSEPETRNIRMFCSEHSFQIAVNYHSYGDLMLFPWGYLAEPSADESLMSDFARIMTLENDYLYGQGSTTIYPTNGDSNDWMYGDTVVKDKILAFTPEIGNSGDGFWPAPSKIIPLCQENMYLSLTASRLLHNYAEITHISQTALPDLNGHHTFSIKRIGLADGGVFNVSMLPLDSLIIYYGDTVVFENMGLEQVTMASIPFSLDPSIIPGTIFRYTITLDNGQFSLIDTIERVYGEETIVYNQDFENEFTFTSTGWNKTQVYSHSPVQSFTDSPFGNYLNNAYETFVLDTLVDLSGVSAGFLRFWARWEIETDYDYVAVMLRPDTSTTWYYLGGNYSKSGSEYQVEGQPVYDGVQREWVQEEINLNQWLGEIVQFRFLLVSDEGVRDDGFYLDDLSVGVISTITGMQENKLWSDGQSVRWYPNPTTGILWLEATDNLLTGQVEVRLLNLNGKLVKEYMLNESGCLDVNELPSGFYIIETSVDQSDSIFQKIIIQ